MELATLFFSFFAGRYVFSSFFSLFSLFLLLNEAAIATGCTMSARIVLAVHGLERAYQVIDGDGGGQQDDDDDKGFLHIISYLGV